MMMTSPVPEVRTSPSDLGRLVPLPHGGKHMSLTPSMPLSPSAPMTPRRMTGAGGGGAHIDVLSPTNALPTRSPAGFGHVFDQQQELGLENTSDDHEEEMMHDEDDGGGNDPINSQAAAARAALAASAADEGSGAGLGGASGSQQQQQQRKHRESVKFSNFARQLQCFSYLLLLSGLRQQTTDRYRYFIRISTWGCCLMCLANLVARTTSYRNTLFDVTLTLMHAWVSLSYERWNTFVATAHWKKMMSIVIKKESSFFSAHLNTIGLAGLVLVCGAVLTVILGWIAPIWGMLFSELTFDAAWFFMLAHGIFMTVIIVPWASVCIASMLLFHMVVFTHQSDIDMLWDGLAALVSGSNNRFEALHYNPCTHMHFQMRSRLRKTCHHFQWIYLGFIVVSFLLFTSGVYNINFMLADREPFSDPTRRWNHLIQDVFFLGLGLVSINGSMWITSGLTRYFQFFMHKVNDLGHVAHIDDAPSHQALVAYLHRSDTGFVMFLDILVTRERFVYLLSAYAQLLAVSLWLYNQS
jgi:hypothetical protein